MAGYWKLDPNRPVSSARTRRNRHWQRPSSGFPILFLDYVGNARINGCGDAILFLPKVESNHGIRDRAPDPLTHFADTRPLEHVGAAKNGMRWTPRRSGKIVLPRREPKLSPVRRKENDPSAEAWSLSLSRAPDKSLFGCNGTSNAAVRVVRDLLTLW